MEQIGRISYLSESFISEESSKRFVKARLRDGHESVVEFSNMTVLFNCNRKISHQLVRQRICSFMQESTRHCKYDKDVTFIIPPKLQGIIQEGSYNESILEYIPNCTWLEHMIMAERNYKKLLDSGWNPEDASDVLPHAVKTTIVISTNFREWRLIFKQRCALAAHPQMRELMIPLLKDAKTVVPVIFDDLEF